MKRAVFCLVACALGTASLPAAWTSPHPVVQEEQAPVPLLPFPAHVEWKEGRCPLQAPVDAGCDPALADRLGPEGYMLEVSPGAVSLRAATDAGIFYARQTLARAAGIPSE